MEYLAERPLALPEVVASAGGSADVAAVSPSFERGAVLLRASDGRLLRLSWEEPGAERRRWLAPGHYQLVGYRLIASDGKESWHVSASAVRDQAFDFVAGGTNTLEIDATVTIEQKVQKDGLQVAIRGAARAGLSIYKGGQRIPIRFRRLDAQGKTLGEGKLEYG